MAVQFSGATTPPVPSKQAEQKPSGGCGCGSNERRADDKPKVVVASKRPKGERRKSFGTSLRWGIGSGANIPVVRTGEPVIVAVEPGQPVGERKD